MTTLALSNLGTLIGVSASLPATYDSTGYSALSYTNIAEVTDIGEFGRVYDEITHQPLADGNKYKFKGGYDSGKIALQMARAVADAGQAILVTAANSAADYTFHITTPDARDFYFTAKVMSFKVMIGAINKIVGSTADLAITNPPIETA